MRVNPISWLRRKREGSGTPPPTSHTNRSDDMKIQIKQVESIKATRIHLDPEAGGA
jgi:hypothetical protein